MPGQIRRLDHVLADAARQSRQAGGLKVEGLARLHGELGAAAVSHGQAVGALGGGIPCKCTRHPPIPLFHRTSTCVAITQRDFT